MKYDSHAYRRHNLYTEKVPNIITVLQVTVHCILTGEASNAVQATKIINSIIPSTVSTQTVRNTLKAANLKAVTNEKKPLLSPTHRKKRLAFALKH
jgi:hypothetical protein